MKLMPGWRRCLCFALGCWAWGGLSPIVYAESQDIRFPIVQLFDTNTLSDDDPSTDSFATFESWTLIPEDTTDRTWKGDTVITNGPIALLFPKDRIGTELFSLQSDVPELQAVIMPESLNDPTDASIESISIVENTQAAATIEIKYTASGKSLAVQFTLTASDVAIRMNPGANCTSLVIRSKWEYAVVPDFFADDLIFTAPQQGTDSLLLPVENVFLLLGGQGNRLLMGVVQSNQSTVHAICNDKNELGLRIRCAPSEPVYLATLSQAKIWSDRLEAWTPPFPAKWRTSDRQADGMCLSITRSQFDRASINPSDETVAYPIDRDPETPLLAMLPTDVLRNTLGVGPCKNILEAERFGADDRSTPAEAAAWIHKQFETQKDARYEKEIRQRLDSMQTLCRQSYTRIEEYLQFANTLKSDCDRQLQKQIPESPLLSAIGATARQLSDSMTAVRDQLQSPETVATLSNNLNNLIGKENATLDAAAICTQLAGIGAAQNYTLSKCRTTIRWIRAQCLMALESDGPSADFLRETAERTSRLLQYQ